MSGFQFAMPAAVSAADAPVPLGTAQAYGVLGGSTVTNTGSTLITPTAGGDVGVSPGSAITGFPPGLAAGTIHAADASATQAQTDLTTAYNNAAARPTTRDLTGQDLGGLTLTPGVYAFSSSAQLTGDLTLDAQGDPNGVFVFKIGSTLTAASGSRVLLRNSARFCRTFWQVGSSATLGTSSEFAGHILALTSITANTGATVHGQLLARNGAVTLDTNTITNDFCIDALAAVTVVKTLAPGQASTVQVGDTVSYAIGVTNSGTTTLTTVPLTDVFDPAHLAFVSASPTPDATAPGSVIWNDLTGAGSLAPGATITVTATFRATAVGSSVIDTATVAGASTAQGQQAPTAFDTETSRVIAPQTPGELQITKTADPAAGTIVVPGETIQYRIGYSNSGETTVTDAALVDVLGAAVTYQPGTLELNGVPIPDSGNYDPATHTIDVALGPVGPGASGALTFRVTVGPYAVSRAGIMNVASWTQQGEVIATTPPVYHYVDSLNFTKGVVNTSGSVVRTGSILKWTIVVTNRGIVPATNVVVSDKVPPNTTYVRRSITGVGHDDSKAPALLWRVGTIGVGGRVTLTFMSAVNANVANGTYISNRAWMRSDQGPPKSSTAQAGRVNDTTTAVVRTSGAEDMTLGLMGLLAAMSVGFAWRGRPGGSFGGKRGARITTAALLSAMLLVGGMEVGAAFGLPLPSPGEGMVAATRMVTAARSATSDVAGSVSGRVTLPTIGVSQKLVESRSMKALGQGLWHQPPSARPGDAGACVIAGHRISSQFAALGRVKVGDRVWVTIGRRSYKYRVASVDSYPANGATLGFRTGVKEKLILYTCLPRWQGDKRTVVVCYRTSN